MLDGKVAVRRERLKGKGRVPHETGPEGERVGGGRG